MKTSLLVLISAMTSLAPTMATAQANPADEKVNQVIVYGDDPCPRSMGDEIVVCARRPDKDRYRIPENLRTDKDSPGSKSWAERAKSLEYVGSTGIQSCSTVGPGGFTGCWAEMMREAREDQRRNAQPRR
jgi:hypothetical protein